MSSHTTRASIQLDMGGNGGELIALISFTRTKVIPETGPTYECAGEPASGGEIEITNIRYYMGDSLEPAVSAPWLDNWVKANVDIDQSPFDTFEAN